MYYAAMSCSELWATVPELKKSEVCNQSIVKREIKGLYSELTDGQCYTRHNIEQLVNTQSKKEMTVQTDFGCYCWEFQVQAQYLKEQNKIMDCEVNHEFWRGITGELRMNLM